MHNNNASYINFTYFNNLKIITMNSSIIYKNNREENIAYYKAKKKEIIKKIDQKLKATSSKSLKFKLFILKYYELTKCTTLQNLYIKF